MSIWRHACAERDILLKDSIKDRCPYCAQNLGELSYIGAEHRSSDGFVSDFRGAICESCGWWVIKLYRIISQDEIPAYNASLIQDGIIPTFVHRMYYAHATLKEFDISSPDSAVEEIRDYLTAKYDERFSVDPRLMEETVASVYRDLGWSTHVTAYQKDGGIDVVLYSGERMIAVQVKRTKTRIGVELLRQFAGALLGEGILHGVFVTTSDFTAGAKTYVNSKLSTHKIELIDAPRLFDALRIAQRGKYKSVSDIFSDIGFEAISLEKPYSESLFQRYFHREMSAAVINLRE